ncbi:dynamin family protein [Magnetospira sp. QH-2]|uniref:dynamin family protein n=1 Tax=Magnetospira sp. (strain QH-2) TaxID=1288970 RepID=UPI0003E8157A|nr:dynamin family protein [Magnetospira sp. QH-2]CCQ75178.1 conserved protein of unknown function [Magnetospira sp. QH-2]
MLQTHSPKFLSKRLRSLEEHLQGENPILVEFLPTFYRLDKMLHRMGLLDRDSSLATRISWWPVVAVLGTFSSGKSTFINAYIGDKLQETGNQAVDDKFTVVCYRTPTQGQNLTLPGTALDADPRFPFFRMSREIEKVHEGEGKHIESYLQLKTTSEENLRGKIVIDSPGFDADDQRRSTLRITDHIIDLSDLVLVFFDARHPEPGAMQDTLKHLVTTTRQRTDASKFLYILNQIDTTAKEDNPEAVVGAWQRAIAQAGLTTGRFYCIYNPEAAVPIEDAALRQRFESKRDEDMRAILGRMGEVEIQRSYRIVGVLETVVNEVETEIVPKLRAAVDKWRRGVVIGDLVAYALLIIGALALVIGMDWLPGPEDGLLAWLGAHSLDIGVGVGAVVAMGLGFHFWLRGVMARRVAAKLPEVVGQVELNLKQAFLRNTKFYRSIFAKDPAGWGKRALRKFQALRETAAQHVQRLNDCYADPSGRLNQPEPPKLAAVQEMAPPTVPAPEEVPPVMVEK